MPPKGSGRKNSGKARSSAAEAPETAQTAITNAGQLLNVRTDWRSAHVRTLASGHQVHISVLFQEMEIPRKVEVDRMAHLHLSQVSHLGDISLSIAPVQGNRHQLVPGPRRI